MMREVKVGVDYWLKKQIQQLEIEKEKDRRNMAEMTEMLEKKIDNNQYQMKLSF